MEKGSNRNEIEANVKLAARIFESGKAAFILAELVRRGVMCPGQPRHTHRQEHESSGKREGDTDEDQDRKVLRQIDQRADSPC